MYLLENQKILAVECIFAELLQGAKSIRDRDILISYWENLPKSIVKDMDALPIQSGLPELRRQDFDGLWHLHILHLSIMDTNSHDLKSKHDALKNLDYMKLGRKEIEKAFKSSNDLAVKAKIGWLVRYFNEYAVSFGLPKIQVME